MADIEIVVKIPKKFYKKVKYGRSANNLINNAIANGTPFNKVIDKIRAEIEKLPTEKCTETRRIYIDADDFKENVLAILDKYKAESEATL